MPKNPIILIVDDDADVRALVDTLLTPAGYDVHGVPSVLQARNALKKLRPDLLILDRNLPGTDGLAFLKQLRLHDEYRGLPILLLTAERTLMDKADGLTSGGDDYMVKPFSGIELVARIGALLRRTRPAEEPSRRLVAGGLVLDLEAHTAEIAGKPLSLSAREFELLAAFLEKPGHMLTRRFLLERVWGAGAELKMSTKTVDVAIGRLRSSLGPWGKRLEALPSYGYRLNPED